MNLKQKNDQDANDFRLLMATKPGRRIVYDLLFRCRVFQQSFSVDDRQTSFNEGARSIGLYLLDRCNSLAPDEYALMMAEQSDNVVEQEVQEDE